MAEQAQQIRSTLASRRGPILWAADRDGAGSGVVVEPAGPVAVCTRCSACGRTCPSCVQRRRRAWSLVNEGGETFESAARMMKLAPQRLCELVEEEADRRDLASFRCDSIPVHLTRGVIADALVRDPDLTLADIAAWLDMRQIDFERMFLGKTKDGRPKQRVTVSSASRLMIALGRAPNELSGC